MEELFIKLKDGRVGLGKEYGNKGYFWIDGPNFYLDNITIKDIDWAIPTRQVDKCMQLIKMLKNIEI